METLFGSNGTSERQANIASTSGTSRKNKRRIHTENNSQVPHTPKKIKGPLLVPRKIPSQNLAHRLMMRETFGTSHHRGTKKVSTSRGFYLNVFPNYTLVNVEKPPCFLRKFTPDGRHFIAFSPCQTYLEIYLFLGPSSGSELIHECTCKSNSNQDYLGSEDTPQNNKLRNGIFSKFFELVAAVPLCTSNNGEQLNRECSLFTECGRYVIVGSACYLSDDPHPRMHQIYRNNESVSPNPKHPLEDYTLYCVDIEEGCLTDSIQFKIDKIFLSHNQGIYLYKDRLSILSVQHQTIHIYRLENGLFVEVVKLGRTLHDTDEYLLNVTGQSHGQQASTLPHSRAYGPRPYRNYREGVINQLKHRILVFLYKRAVAISQCKEDNHPYQIRKFYQYFDQIRSLRMWKMQLLDEYHILIKYASEEVVTQRLQDGNSQISIFVVFNMETTEVLSVYENTSDELLQHFENFCDFFRNTNFRGNRGSSNYIRSQNNTLLDYEGGQHQVTSSPSNNVYANLLQQRFKQTIVSAKHGGLTEARKRVLAQLPISAQSYTGSPYLSLDLFSYDEKWVSVMERPKCCGEQPIQFYGRDCGLLKFRIFAGIVPANLRNAPTNARRLVAFIFHPTDPFAISVQRTNLEYVVNFHVRKCTTCQCAPISKSK